MTPRERVQAVYHRQVPDQVPLMLDLSHWYKKNAGVPFDLTGFKGVEEPLVELHKRVGAVAYVEMGGFYDLVYDDPGVTVRQRTESGSSTRASKRRLGPWRRSGYGIPPATRMLSGSICSRAWTTSPSFAS